MAPSSAWAGDERAIGSISTAHLVIPSDAGGELVPFATGAGASLTYLDVDDGLTGGFEVSTLFLGGNDGQRLFDLGLSVIASMPLEKKLLAPYIIFGLDLAATTFADPPAAAAADDSWVSLGVHGGIGLHGFLSKDIYFRGEVGYLGAGVGGLTAKLAIGWTFGRGF